jgi:hypothetical protein
MTEHRYVGKLPREDFNEDRGRDILLMNESADASIERTEVE